MEIPPHAVQYYSLRLLIIMYVTCTYITECSMLHIHYTSNALMHEALNEGSILTMCVRTYVHVCVHHVHVCGILDSGYSLRVINLEKIILWSTQHVHVHISQTVLL